MKLIEKQYNRKNVVEYAQKWALKRNPLYYSFDKVGGDCTNFVSQCLFEGAKVMNYTPTLGWYYFTANIKSPSWTGTKYLYNFLVTNKQEGPFGLECRIEDLEEGDIVQIANSDYYYHSMIVTKIKSHSHKGIFVSSHTIDNLNEPISNYSFMKIRYIHIKGVRFLV